MNNDLEFLYVGLALSVVGFMLPAPIGLVLQVFGGLITGSSAYSVWKNIK